MSITKNLSVLVAVAGFSMASLASAATSTNSTNLSSGLRQAKATIDHVIASSGGHTSSGGSSGSGGQGGGNVHWGEGDVNENDALGLPILIEASTSLGQAASYSDQATIAFLGGNIQFGDYRFTLACSQMGISRSQIARANQAALQPPFGFLQAFGTDIANVLVELQQLKFAVGCP